MKRKLIFYNFIVFFFLFFIFDVLLSNFYLDKKNKSCYIIEKNFYSFKKNCSGAEQFKPSFPVVDIFTNSLGLRSKSSKMKIDYQKEKIFLFGDSFTFGLGVNYENSFAGILEEKFLKYQFFNFAVPSYSPSLYSYQLKQAINDNLIPKKIFLFLDLTDVYDEGARWQAEDITEKPELIHDEFKKKNFKKKFTHKHFQFSRQLASSINFNLRKLRTKIKIFVSDDYNEVKTSFQANFTYKDIKMLNKIFWDEKKFKKGIKKIKSNIANISAICDKNNVEFNLVVFPWAETLVHGQDSFNWEDFAKSICPDNNCRLINAFPYFSEIKRENKYWATDLYFINDQHFNINGNKKFAEFLKDNFF